jgi:cytochrome c oxidase cbb3-type subunit IV
MDINTLRIAITLASLVLFIGIVMYSWSRRRDADYADAARLPFADAGPATVAPRAGRDRGANS